MAQFMGVVTGNRNSASRLGSKKSGLAVKANGWDLGIEVYAHHQNDKDLFVVYITGGSNRFMPSQRVLEVHPDKIYLMSGIKVKRVNHAMYS